jgi:hypothetical protein
MRFKTFTIVLTWLLCGLLMVSQAQVTDTYVDEEDEEEESPIGRKNTSQDKQPAPGLLDRIYFGGNLGLSFGDITFIDVSPLVGYRITDKFSSGGGVIYRYFQDRRFAPPVAFSITGGRIFARYDIAPMLFPYAEYELLSFRIRDSQFLSPREWQEAVFIGLGFNQALGGRGQVNVLALYMLNWDITNFIYRSPWVFRVGFIF